MSTGRFRKTSVDHRHRDLRSSSSPNVFENSAAQRNNFTNSRKLLGRLIGASTADSFENHKPPIMPANTAGYDLLIQWRTISCTRVARSVNFINRPSTPCENKKRIQTVYEQYYSFYISIKTLLGWSFSTSNLFFPEREMYLSQKYPRACQIDNLNILQI